MKKKVLISFVSLPLFLWAQTKQLHLPVIDQMPEIPRPVVLRDWKKTARDVDAFVYDFSRAGKHLPVPWWDSSRINYPRDVIAIPSYLGDFRQHKKSNAYDSITCFGAVLGATKVGINKADQSGANWVEMLNAYFQKANGTELYLNNVRAVTGHTFWYEMLPSLLFYQVYDHYRDAPEMKRNFVRTAERWCEAVPNFDCTAYDFKTGKPFDNGKWKEPDAAAGAAWLEYMAFSETGNTKFLTAAEASLRFLDQRAANPYYECILPYGAYISARMNAERGTAHQTEKLVNWVFDGSNPRKWGVISGGWGKQDCAGLTGSVYPDHEYAFTMNTFLTAGVMLPIIRYDDRFACAFGKWMLNVAVNSRFFYPDAWSPEDQTCWDWAKQYDPEFCLAYEGVRKQGCTRTYAVEDVSTVRGKCQGTWEAARFDDNKKQILITDSSGRLEHVWRLQQVSGTEKILVVQMDKPAEKSKYTFYISNRPDRGWREVFTKSSATAERRWMKMDSPGSDDDLYIKVSGEAPAGTRLAVGDLYIQTKLDKVPYASGDPMMFGWGETDIGMYGSVFAGLLGAIVEPTDVEGILRLDCRATESFAAPSYPTHLYYNPYSETKAVTVSLPEVPVDLYDAVANDFIAKEKSGSTSIRIEPKSAVLLVQCPSGGTLSYEDSKTLINGVIIDYNNGQQVK